MKYVLLWDFESAALNVQKILNYFIVDGYRYVRTYVM